VARPRIRRGLHLGMRRQGAAATALWMVFNPNLKFQISDLRSRKDPKRCRAALASALQNYPVRTLVNASPRTSNPPSTLADLSTFLANLPTFLANLPTLLRNSPTLVRNLSTLLANLPTILANPPIALANLPTLLAKLSTILSILPKKPQFDDSMLRPDVILR
jgi:hypothetical protein